MPIWAVAFYDDDFGMAYSLPTRRGVVKAKNEGEAFDLVKAKMGDAKHADCIPQIVRDESVFEDGYRDLPSN